MTISFFGHSNYFYDKSVEEKIKKIIEKKACYNTTFFMGMYGKFDSIALKCVKDFKKNYPKAEICFVTPYIDKSFGKLKDAKIWLIL